MAWSSTVPAALGALVAAFTAAPALGGAGVEIRYARQIGDEAALQVVAVGWDGSGATANAATGAFAPEGLAPLPDREKYAVHCAAAVLDGGGDLSAAAAAAYQLVGAAAAVIAADQTLGHVVMRAAMGATSLQLDPTPDGAKAVVLFDVDCDAFTGR